VARAGGWMGGWLGRGGWQYSRGVANIKVGVSWGGRVAVLVQISTCSDLAGRGSVHVPCDADCWSA
jgi:hypothetical protein